MYVCVYVHAYVAICILSRVNNNYSENIINSWYYSLLYMIIHNKIMLPYNNACVASHVFMYSTNELAVMLTTQSAVEF